MKVPSLSMLSAMVGLAAAAIPPWPPLLYPMPKPVHYYSLKTNQLRADFGCANLCMRVPVNHMGCSSIDWQCACGKLDWMVGDVTKACLDKRCGEDVGKNFTSTFVDWCHKNPYSMIDRERDAWHQVRQKYNLKNFKKVLARTERKKKKQEHRIKKAEGNIKAARKKLKKLDEEIAKALNKIKENNGTVKTAEAELKEVTEKLKTVEKKIADIKEEKKHWLRYGMKPLKMKLPEDKGEAPPEGVETFEDD